MKRQNKTVLIAWLILFLITSINKVQSQWVQSNGPIGGIVRQIVLNSSTDAFIATNGGVFGFLSSGTNWYNANNGLTTLDIRALAVIGNNLFAGGYEVPGTPGGVFLSTNRGNSWTTVNSGLSNRTIISLGVNGTNLLAGTNGAGVFVTTNNGTNWTSASSGLSGASLVINCLASNSNVVYAGTNDGLAISTNNGTNWTVCNNGIPSSYKTINSIAFKTGAIFVATKGGGIYSSTDNGASFTGASGNIGSGYVNALLYDGTYLTAGTNAGVFRSSNNGVNWTAFNSGLTNLIVTTITNVVSPNYNYIGTQGDGVFYCLNYSGWVNHVAGLYNTSPRAFCIKGSDIYTGTIYRGIFKSTNSGSNWSTVNSGLPVGIMALDMINDGTNIYAATSSGIYKSINDGASWSNIGNTFTPTNYFQAIVKTGSAIYAGSFGGGVYMTTNEGANWTALNGGLANLNVWDLDYDATYLYAATADGGIFRIPLSGTSWTAINNGLPTGYDIRALNVSGNKIFAGFNGLYYSTDNGGTWTSTANDSLIGKKVRCIYTYDNANKILVGTYNNGIYVSVNGGANFYSANTGFQTLSDVYTISILNGTTVYAGIYGLGIWKRPLSEIVSGIKNISTEIPAAYKLGQNYPNPFNPVTNIRFELSAASNVLLKVYNSAGMEVSTIANGHYGAGVYEASFDASNLSSGVYFYRLITDRYSDTKKMMVVK